MARLDEYTPAESAYFRGDTSEVREGTELLELCRALGRYLHRGQVDKQGAPYHLHLERVAARMPEGSASQCIAWLHDAGEDGVGALGGGFAVALLHGILPESYIDILDLLTRRPGEPYKTGYLYRIAHHPIATAVKLADLADNLDPLRDPIPDSLRRRYEEAQRILREAWPE